MAVKLNITTNVTGQGQITKLNSGLTKLGTQALIAKKRLGNLERAAAKSRATFSALGTTLKIGVAASLAAVTFGLGKFVKDTFAAGRLTESLQVRFKLLFNSVEEGSKAFEVMNKFAAKVPFSLEAIAAGSGNLAVISKDAGDLNKILEVTGNVAATTGLDFRQTAEQIQRAFAGGIAAADVFRERGVRAMLGFEAGAKVSIEETRKKFFEVFANGGQYSKATKDFEKTLEAQVSFVEDAYFQFRQAAAQPLFAGVKKQLIELVGNFKENDHALKELAKSIGEGLAKAFENLGKFVKSVINNFDEIILVIKIFLGLKIGTFIAGLATQFVLLARQIKITTFTMHGLNVAIRANPIGILVTAIQIAVTVFVVFYDEIIKIGKAIGNFLVEKFKKAKIAVLEFISKLTIFPGTSEAAKKAAKDLRNEIDGLASSYTKVTKEQKGYFSGVNMDRRTSKTRKFANMPNPRMDMRGGEIIAAQKVAKIKDFIAEQSHKKKLNFDKIVREAEAKAQENAIVKIKSYRDVLSDAGIESKMIADTISSSWLDGLRQGNSLLDITKNAFKSVLISISDTLVKKSAELLIERLFVSLGNKKITQQKILNSEVGKQGNLMDTIISKGSSLLSSIGGSIGGGKGFASLFSGVRSIFGFAEGGIVPGGAPYTDRIPAMLTPGEVVIPRNKTDNAMGSTSITNINISGNVDQRSIDQIKAVISQSSAEVGGANRTFQRNSQGVRGRGR
ncbi:hypothetical protein Kolga_gp11 [Pelagibacter phage Kolga EXVC016S]|nr:hypothetical protein Kolga_gp11 [Pelagibacter phage Kolga EXVC016S]